MPTEALIFVLIFAGLCFGGMGWPAFLGDLDGVSGFLSPFCVFVAAASFLVAGYLAIAVGDTAGLVFAILIPGFFVVVVVMHWLIEGAEKAAEESRREDYRP